MTSDPIGDALRADAEAARAKLRAEGIACPSCGVNIADLPDSHALVIGSRQPAAWFAECRDGARFTLSPGPMLGAEFAVWQAAATVAVWDEFQRREAEAFDRITGTGPVRLTGLLDVLGSTGTPARRPVP